MLKNLINVLERTDLKLRIKIILPTDLPTNAKFVYKIIEKYNLSFEKLTCVNFKIGVIPN